MDVNRISTSLLCFDKISWQRILGWKYPKKYIFGHELPPWYQVNFNFQFSLQREMKKNPSWLLPPERNNFKQKMKGSLFWPLLILLKPLRHLLLRCLNTVCVHSVICIADVHTQGFEKNKHGAYITIILFRPVNILEVFFSVLTIKEFVLFKKMFVLRCTKSNTIGKYLPAYFTGKPSQMQHICS